MTTPKYTPDQVAQARAEFDVFVAPSQAVHCVDDEDVLDSCEVHRKEGLPAGWAREHGKALLDTLLALQAENRELRQTVEDLEEELADADLEISDLEDAAADRAGA